MSPWNYLLTAKCYNTDTQLYFCSIHMFDSLTHTCISRLKCPWRASLALPFPLMVSTSPVDNLQIKDKDTIIFLSPHRKRVWYCIFEHRYWLTLSHDSGSPDDESLMPIMQSREIPEGVITYMQMVKSSNFCVLFRVSIASQYPYIIMQLRKVQKWPLDLGIGLEPDWTRSKARDIFQDDVDLGVITLSLRKHQDF